MLNNLKCGVLSAYCLDSAGNLILRKESERNEMLIPKAHSIVTRASELLHPFLWTITPAAVIKRISMLPPTLLLGTELEDVISSGRLPSAGYPFVPASSSSDTDEQIEGGIELMETLREGDPLLASLIDAFTQSGLHRIPRVSTFNSDLHIKTAGGTGFEYISDGWMSCTKVYRKSVVRCL